MSSRERAPKTGVDALIGELRRDGADLASFKECFRANFESNSATPPKGGVNAYATVFKGGFGAIHMAVLMAIEGKFRDEIVLFLLEKGANPVWIFEFKKKKKKAINKI
jgi:hypothetical protein